MNERISVFFEHKTALDALDRELDALEDDFEAQYRSGSLRYEDFRLGRPLFRFLSSPKP